MHETLESLEEFEIRPPTAKKIRIDLKLEKRCCQFFSAVFYRILFILAVNDDIHKSLDEFEIRSDPTQDQRVACP